MRLVHAADIHLDSPLRGLDRQEGAPVDAIRGATREAFVNLIDHCLEEDVAALLLAGDIWDGDWRDYSTGLFFAGQLARLRETNARVFFVRGNHDAASRITKHLELPPHCHELSTRKPETVVDEALGLAVHGQGFATREVTSDLAAEYPRALDGLFNVGLLHTSVDGREGHAPYAPTHLETLQGKAYDYWALGHVHQREVLSEDPWVVFCGNLQGRHANETGPKGATVVTVADGRVAEVEHRPLDVVRWVRCEIDASEVAAADDVVDLAGQALESAVAEAEGRLVVARVEVLGATAAHAPLSLDPEHWESAIRAHALDVGRDGAWIEKVAFRTRARLDLGQLAESEGAVGQLLRTLRELRSDDDALLAMARELDDLKRKLPLGAREGDGAVRLDDPDWLREALDDVERTLLPRLLAEE